MIQLGRFEDVVADSGTGHTLQLSASSPWVASYVFDYYKRHFEYCHRSSSPDGLAQAPGNLMDLV